MMEPHASIAAWDGDKLTLWTSNQMIDWSAGDLAKTLGIPKENVRLISPFIGGGFGGKLFVRADALLAALGARAAGRPVKVALPRPLMFNNTTHRPATIQRIRIGATQDGKITAIGHESWSGDLPGGEPEAAVQQTRLLYAGANRMTATRLAVLDLPEGNAMRAPGEAPGMMALEIAMDEMAEKLGIDPIEFRILNDTQVDPEKPERPFSQRQLDRVPAHRRRALRLEQAQSAARPDPRRALADRHGRRRRVPQQPGDEVGRARAARQPRHRDGRDRHDRHRHRQLHDHRPDRGRDDGRAARQGGRAARRLDLSGLVRLGRAMGRQQLDRRRLCRLRQAARGGGAEARLQLRRRGVRGRRRSARAIAACRSPRPRGESGLVAEDAIEFGDLDKKYQQSTFGAHFVEVGVDAATGEIRVRRMLAVCAAGRILNPKSARSQVIGAMTMGVGAALMEELAVDKRLGFFVNHDLAGYEVPVHADIPHQEVIFLDETDPMSSPMKAKGVGELGICGVGAAVANAIYNATGVRVRDYPITLDKLLDRLPDVG